MSNDKPCSEILNDVSTDLFDIDDCLNKIEHLVRDISDQYMMPGSGEINRETVRKIGIPFHSDDESIRNAGMWICHHGRVMLIMDMIDDYVSKCRKITDAAMEKADEENGKTLLKYMETLGGKKNEQ